MAKLSKENVGNGIVIDGVLCRSWVEDPYDGVIPFEPKKHGKYLAKKFLEVLPSEVLENAEDSEEDGEPDYEVELNPGGFNKVKML